jgi:sialate O-acetylesterase
MRNLAAALVLLALTAAAAPSARAEVRLHPLFGDLAVLQRGAAVPVFGTAEPGESVSITLTRPDGEVTDWAPVAAGADGRWTLTLPDDLPPGTGYTLAVRGKADTITLRDLAVGDVWICSGQSNMGMPVRACADAEAATAGSRNPRLRLYQLKLKASPEPLSDFKDLAHLTRWAEAGPDTVPGFSAVAYHFGAHLQKRLPGDVPVGLIQTAWGGTPGEAWVSREALNAEPELRHYHERLPAAVRAYDPAKAEADHQAAPAKWEKAAAQAKSEGRPAPRRPLKAADPRTSQGSPSNLFNSLIHPLLKYPVRGVIWYQGEANGSRAAEYRTLLPTLIRDWRARWGREFPFLVVQLPGWSVGNPDGVNWAELREAQALTAGNLPKVGLAVTLHLGEKDDVHPKRKQPVGERLARIALATEYGQKVGFAGPTFERLMVADGEAEVAFGNTGGRLTATREQPSGFAVAGADGVYHPADAVIRGDTVVLRSDKVARPVSVRYGWKNWPEANLTGADGLPAAPFRTDDQPLTTARRK